VNVIQVSVATLEFAPRLSMLYVLDFLERFVKGAFCFSASVRLTSLDGSPGLGILEQLVPFSTTS